MTPVPNSSPNNAPARRGVRLALVGAVVLLIAAVAAFYFASRMAHEKRAANEDGAITVVIQGKQCDPNALTVPAGKTTFKIVNKSERAVEWEILDGVMVIEERENIAPGFTQTLTAMLEPGDYQITCGLLSNPRGTLHVSATDASKAALAARPRLVDFVGALAEYRVYLTQQVNGLVNETQALASAVDANQSDSAREHYLAAYAHYARLEPASGMFSDLATRIDGQAAYFEKRETDPEYRGFRRLGAALANVPGSASPVPSSDVSAAALARQLADDATALQQRLKSVTVPPERMIGGAARLGEQLATMGAQDQDGPISGDTSGFGAQINQARTQAALAGMRRVHELLRPFVARRDEPLASAIDANFDAAQSDTKPAALKALAASLDKVEGALGYE